MRKPAKVASLGKDGQRVDRSDPADHAQELIIAVLAEQGVSGALNLIALPDEAACLCDDHAEHGDRYGILVDRQCHRGAGGLINIVD